MHLELVCVYYVLYLARSSTTRQVKSANVGQNRP